MLQAWDPHSSVRRIDAAAAVDACGTTVYDPAGVSVVVGPGDGGELLLLGLGTRTEVAASSRWRNAPVISRPGHLILPGLVNAHTHLDLTHIGPMPHDPSDGFEAWIDLIRRLRHHDHDQIARSVRQGTEASLAGGVVLVGDIAGAVRGRPSLAAAQALAHYGRINAVSFVEFFAQGQYALSNAHAAAGMVNSAAGLGASSPGPRTVWGLSPHAPYSVCIEAYATALDELPDGTPVCTHLAESAPERDFVSAACGPFVQLLRSLSLWDDERVPTGIGAGFSPVELLTRHLSNHRVVAVHANDLDRDDPVRLASARWPVVYCPRASAYFGAPAVFGHHKYRALLDAGLPVAVGTDSIVNLDTPDRITVWDELSLLWRRDRLEPSVLLAMATTHGARALGRNPDMFCLRHGHPVAGLIAVPAAVPNRNPTPSELLAAALQQPMKPELLAIGRV